MALLAAAGALLLAGCGFHLRGDLTGDLAPELARVQVTGADRDLVARLTEALAQRGAVVVAGSAADAAVINLSAARFQRAALTTDSAGRTSAYALSYEVTFSITAGAAGGAPLQAAQTLSLNRALDYHPNRQLQAEEETRFLETEMRREMVTQILWRLMRL